MTKADPQPSTIADIQVHAPAATIENLVADARKAAAAATAELSSALDRIRERIRAIDIELTSFEHLPLSRAECEGRLHARVHGRGNDYRNFLATMMDPPQPTYGLVPHVSPFVDMYAMELLCLVAPDKIIEATMAICDERANDLGGWPQLTMAQRAIRRKELEAEMRQLEVEEESIVSGAEGAGFNLSRRPNASPAAILGLEQ